jgi:hypothetical protein
VTDVGTVIARGNVATLIDGARGIGLVVAEMPASDCNPSSVGSFRILTHDDTAQFLVERMLRASTQTTSTALGAAADFEAA